MSRHIVGWSVLELLNMSSCLREEVLEWAWAVTPEDIRNAALDMQVRVEDNHVYVDFLMEEDGG